MTIPKASRAVPVRTKLATVATTGNPPEGGSGFLGMFMIDLSFRGPGDGFTLAVTPPWLFWFVMLLIVMLVVIPPVWAPEGVVDSSIR